MPVSEEYIGAVEAKETEALNLASEKSDILYGIYDQYKDGRVSSDALRSAGLGLDDALMALPEYTRIQIKLDLENIVNEINYLESKGFAYEGLVRNLFILGANLTPGQQGQIYQLPAGF